jgi:hypothetical protein
MDGEMFGNAAGAREGAGGRRVQEITRAGVEASTACGMPRS